MSSYAPRVNELYPEILAIHSLNAFAMDNSPPRGVMFASHFAQRPVIEGSEPNLIQTGIAEEFGKYTFGIRMPEEGTIMRIIERYPTQGIGTEGIRFNPETLVIYRSHETGRYDCFTIPYYASYHPSFGFKYEMKPAYQSLAEGRAFDKDTVFADSPAIKGESHYTYGKNLNVAYMSHPNVGLDGYVISKAVLPDFRFRVYVQRQIAFGDRTFLTNLYGTDEEYKGIPDIGDMVRDDGLLANIRQFDPYLSPALISKKDLKEVYYTSDNKVYARMGEGRVVDVSVIKSENVNRQLPPEMTAQLEKYAEAGQRFHREIVRFEERLIAEDKNRGGTGRIPISEKLKRLIIESKAIINYRTSHPKAALSLLYRREPLNNWFVTVTVEYIVTPNRGFKITCDSGGSPMGHACLACEG